MAFFTKSTDLDNVKTHVPPDRTEGRVYVLRFTLDDGTILHKVGMCNSSRSTDRMMEILRSFFNKYRYVPHCELRRDKKVIVPLLVEKHLHCILDEWSYTFDKKFGGSTEFFHSLDEEVLLDYLDEFDYADLLKGQTNMNTDDYYAISKHINENRARLDKEASKNANNELPF